MMLVVLIAIARAHGAASVPSPNGLNVEQPLAVYTAGLLSAAWSFERETLPPWS
jgi:hypothetical protein